MKISRDVDGDKYIYIGQFRQGTKDADGIGIQVWRDGTTINLKRELEGEENGFLIFKI